MITNTKTNGYGCHTKSNTQAFITSIILIFPNWEQITCPKLSKQINYSSYV
jgi:hypothetical protein